MFSQRRIDAVAAKEGITPMQAYRRLQYLEMLERSKGERHRGSLHTRPIQ